MDNGTSNTEEHFRHGIDRLKAPVAGRMAVTGLMFVVFSGALSGFGLSSPGYYALAGVVCVELLLLCYRLWRRKSNRAKALRQYKQLDELKQQEFALRYEEAKLNGQLDRWNKPQ